MSVRNWVWLKKTQMYVYQVWYFVVLSCGVIYALAKWVDTVSQTSPVCLVTALSPHFLTTRGSPSGTGNRVGILQISHCRSSVAAFRSAGTGPEWGISPHSAIKNIYMEVELKKKFGDGGVTLLPCVVLTTADVMGGWCKHLLIASPVIDVSNKPEIALRKFSH